MAFLRVYNASPEDKRKEWASWYVRARQEIVRMSREYQTPTPTVAGVVAALSQRSRWAQNMRQANICLRGERPRGLRLAVNRAVRIAGGERPEDVLGGNKVRAFYLALTGDDNVVVLDTWMLRAAERETGEKLTERQYARLSEKLRREARQVGLKPAEYQAIVWCQIRGGGK